MENKPDSRSTDVSDKVCAGHHDQFGVPKLNGYASPKHDVEEMAVRQSIVSGRYLEQKGRNIGTWMSEMTQR